MREVARLRNLLSGFVTTLKRLFESVMGTLFCLLLYIHVTATCIGDDYNSPAVLLYCIHAPLLLSTAP